MSFPQTALVNRINVMNESTVVTDTDVTKMVSALNQILPAFARDWKIPVVHAAVVPKSTSTLEAAMLPISIPLPFGSIELNVVLMDTTDISGTAGYHTLYNGTATVKIFAKTILMAGGVSLYEDTRTKNSVSQVLCHEVLEAIIDPKSTQWVLNPNTGTMYALEVGDVVDGNVKVVRLSDGSRIMVSDWVLPAWYDAEDTVGPYNSLDTLSAPFTLSPNGYAMTTSGGTINYLYGSTLSDATKNYLQLSLRTLTRVTALRGL